MNIRVAMLLVLWFTFASATFAMDCPDPPKQASKDVQSDVEVAVARIGPVKGGELAAKTRIITQDLLGKLPDANKLYLEQMLFSAYCSALRDDRSISEGEKATRLRDYAREVRGTIAAASAPKTKDSGQSATNAKQGTQARWKLAWEAVNDVYDKKTFPVTNEAGFEHFNRAALLRIVRRVDVSMDKQLVRDQALIVEQIEKLPTSYNSVFGTYYDVVMTDRLSNALEKFRMDIRRGAILSGVEISSR